MQYCINIVLLVLIMDTNKFYTSTCLDYLEGIVIYVIQSKDGEKLFLYSIFSGIFLYGTKFTDLGIDNKF